MSATETPQPLQRVLDGIERAVSAEGRRYDARSSSGDQYTVVCPAHDDNDPSLSVGYDNGKVLLRCQGGCETADVLKAAGLTWKDLKQGRTIAATYDYLAEDDTLRYQVVRYEPKTFSQRRPDPDRPGGWINNMQGVAPLLFHLPTVAEAIDLGDDVWIVEGEKDALALWERARAIATCNHGGAGKWRSEHSERFRDTTSRVRIVADRDAPGYRHALQVQASLAEVGVAAEIVLAATGKDAADHIAAHGLDEFLPTTADALRELLGGDTATDVAPELLPFTETGNAERLARRHGADLRYVAPWRRWQLFNGRRWEDDALGKVMALAKSTVRSIAAEPRDGAIVWAEKSESRSRLESTVILTQSEPGIAIMPTAFDADPLLLNVRNGTLDLRTGELRPHRRDDLLRLLIDVDYEVSAAAPVFEAFLARILPDPEVRRFLQRCVGYSLTGDTTEQKLLMLIGTGANGKSTLVELLSELLGDYAKSLAAEAFVQRGGLERIPNDIARLVGARFVSVMEFDDSAQLNERLVKQLTGGDTVTARFMRAEWFDFRPQAKFWVSSNHYPVVRGTDDGIWRRFLLVNFPVRIAPEDMDRDLPAKLRRELPGVLAWAVEGARQWGEQGLNPPASIIAATANYRQESDALGRFLDDECDIGPQEAVTKSVLYDTYKRWCTENGLRAMTNIALGRKLAERPELAHLTDGRKGKLKVHMWFGLTVREVGLVHRLSEAAQSAEDGAATEPLRPATEPPRRKRR